MNILITFRQEQHGQVLTKQPSCDLKQLYKSTCEIYDKLVNEPNFSIEAFSNAISKSITDDTSNKNENIDVEIMVDYNYLTYTIYKCNAMIMAEKHINPKSLTAETCINKFVDKCILSNMHSMSQFAYDIKSRNYEREKIMSEYHQSGCYERDVSEIIDIKNKAQKIIDLCNKKLEALFENYTK